MTRGWITGEPPSLEEVEEHISEIRDATDPVLPAGLAEEIELTQTLLGLERRRPLDEVVPGEHVDEGNKRDD